MSGQMLALDLKTQTSKQLWISHLSAFCAYTFSRALEGLVLSRHGPGPFNKPTSKRRKVNQGPRSHPTNPKRKNNQGKNLNRAFFFFPRTPNLPQSHVRLQVAPPFHSIPPNASPQLVVALIARGQALQDLLGLLSPRICSIGVLVWEFFLFPTKTSTR